MGSHVGEFCALGAAVCWALNAVAFESAGKTVGSLSVNYIRLFIAFALLSAVSFFRRGLMFPTDATSHAWIWLTISGLFGFVLGDAFLFQAFVDIGSRVSLLIASLAPPITALIGFLVLKEMISPLGVLGIFVIMLGICLVVLNRNVSEEKVKVEFSRPVRGIVFASLGALGQSLGLVSTKFGMGSYDIFAATQIRLLAGIIAVTIMVCVNAKWHEIKSAFYNKRAMKEIAVGAILGPFIGVSLSLLALQNTATGIVSSITSMSPVVVIPASIMVFKEKVAPKEVLGALVTIIGVVILFM